MAEELNLFRKAMRSVAATVNIVTTSTEDYPMGMTATAVSSLAADPASVLVCINQSASMHDSLALASHFCVNVLNRAQASIARTFSDSSLRDVRFAAGDWDLYSGRPPRLLDAQASLVCERTQLIAFATHTICIGTVTSVHVRDEVDPLVYLNGKFVGAALEPIVH